MEVISTIRNLRELLLGIKKEHKSIGLVPTMGFLHEGHLSLIKEAKAKNDVVVVSIFVNPIQFGPTEDFSKYPRDLNRDVELAGSVGADVVFAPSVDEMYPRAILTTVEVSELGEWLCGKSRPGHFRGVTTVVSKLFNIVQPDRAYFGEKDAQQLAIVKQMVQDLNFPVEIVPVPIVREKDGLAMSSRNVYLTAAERQSALVLNKSLQRAKELFLAGERNSNKIKEQMITLIGSVQGAEIDYVEICDSLNLLPVEIINDTALVALAVRFGRTRLIDNLTLAEV